MSFLRSCLTGYFAVGMSERQGKEEAGRWKKIRPSDGLSSHSVSGSFVSSVLVDSVFFENSFDTLTESFLFRKRDQSSTRNGLDRCDVKTADLNLDLSL